MNIQQTAGRDIETIDSNVAPSENAVVPSEDPAISTSGIGQTHEVADVAGLPAGSTSTVNESVPKPSGFVSSDDAISSEPQAGESQDDLAKDDPRRHEYWQSKHDKVMSELSEARNQINYYQDTLEPISQGLKQNPDILNALEQRVTGSNGHVSGSPPMQQQQQMPQQQVAGNQQPSMQPPIRPQKPVTYSEVDAFNDPESESFKHRQSREEYFDKVVDYYGNVEAMRNQAAMQYMNQQQNAMHLNNIKTQAVKAMGYDDTKADRFVQYVRNPKNITTERLAALFEMEEAHRNGQSKENVERQRKSDEYQRQIDMQAMQPPVSLETCPATPQLTEEDNFNAWLLGQSTKNK